jgi:hypothetical protein
MAMGTSKGGYCERDRFGAGIAEMPSSRMRTSDAERRSVVDDAGVVVSEGVGARVDVVDATLLNRGRLGREMGRMGWGAWILGPGDVGVSLSIGEGGITSGMIMFSAYGGGGGGG